MKGNKTLDHTPTHWGKYSANWKDDTSIINTLVRVNKRFYSEWIFPILKRDGFKCTECDKTETLEVHHINESMTKIFKKIEKVNNTSIMVNNVIDYHLENNVDGKTLCVECHKKVHPNYSKLKRF